MALTVNGGSVGSLGWGVDNIDNGGNGQLNNIRNGMGELKPGLSKMNSASLLAMLDTLMARFDVQQHSALGADGLKSAIADVKAMVSMVQNQMSKINAAYNDAVTAANKQEHAAKTDMEIDAGMMAGAAVLSGIGGAMGTGSAGVEVGIGATLSSLGQALPNFGSGLSGDVTAGETDAAGIDNAAAQKAQGEEGAIQQVASAVIEALQNLEKNLNDMLTKVDDTVGSNQNSIIQAMDKH